MDKKIDKILQDAQKDFNIEIDNSYIKNIESSLSVKDLKMIKLVAIYTTARKHENPLQRLEILYKDNSALDWLNDRDGDFYKLYSYYKQKLNIMLNENSNAFTLKANDHKIDNRHPLYKQILFKKLYHLSLLNNKHLENKLKHIENDNFKLHYGYINESIDWFKILSNNLDDDENKKFTRVELPSIQQILPKLSDVTLNYNLDVNKLKLMKSNIDKEKEIEKYFKTDMMAMVKKRKLDSHKVNTNTTKKQKKSKSKRVVMDSNVTRA
ncbi:unnamed protein product [Hanseniaspora opuntiae]